MPGYFVAAATLTFVVSKEPPGAVEEVIVIECVELDVVKHGVVHVILFSLMTWMLVHMSPPVPMDMARSVASVKFEPISVS